MRCSPMRGSNDIVAFLSIFAPNAKMKHPVLSNEDSPRALADVMNCNVKETTRLRTFAPLKGDGSGADDTIEMEFEESGLELDYAPHRRGRMCIKAVVEQHRIERMEPHGFRVG